MEKIIDGIFKREGVLTRMEYFIANVVILIVCILWAVITSGLLVVMTSDIYIVMSFLISTIPMLGFFTYTGLNITWKRGKDFLKTSYLTYLFFGVIIFGTWLPAIVQLMGLTRPEYFIYLFHPLVLIFGVILNILWIILWLIFQFVPTKK